jgi:hypothetical protein
MHLSRHTDIVWAVVLFLGVATEEIAGASWTQRQTVYLPFVTKNPLPALTPIPSATRTPTPTSSPPFSGVAQTVQSHNWMVGDGLLVRR